MRETADLPSLNNLTLDDNSKETHEILNQTSQLSLSVETTQYLKRTPNHFLRESVIKHDYSPRNSSPLRSMPYSAENLAKIDSDETLPDADDESDIIMEDVDSFGSTMASLMSLSPTIIGARVATHGTPLRSRTNIRERLCLAQKLNAGDDSMEDESALSSGSDSSVGNLKSRHSTNFPSTLSQEILPSESEESDSVSDVSFDESTPSRLVPYNNTNNQKWQRNAPIQFQMHHHHYYPQISPSHGLQNSDFDDDSIMLPAPWSKIAEPKAPTPYLISSYLQLVFNAITSSVAIYILVSAIRTVKSDINFKMEEYARDIALEVSLCTRNYIENKCDPETRAPRLEEACVAWERCKNRDPSLQASKASVSAETLGVILNSLIEPIGSKAIVVFVLGFAAWAFTSNFIFGFVRAKSYYGWHSGKQDQPSEQDVLQFQDPLKQVSNAYYSDNPMVHYSSSS